MEKELVSKYLGVGVEESDIKSVEYESDGTISEIVMKDGKFTFKILPKEEIVELCKKVIEENSNENSVFTATDYEIFIVDCFNNGLYLTYDAKKNVGTLIPENASYAEDDIIILDDFTKGNGEVITYIFGEFKINRDLYDEENISYIAEPIMETSTNKKSKEEIAEEIAKCRALVSNNKNARKPREE